MHCLENDSFRIELTPCAAAIHRLFIKKDGRQIVYPLESEKAHLHDPSYANDTIGCYAGRVRNASLSIDGETNYLDKNDGNNSLHGGTKELSSRVWRTETEEREEVSYSIEVKDKADGLPGNRTIHACYHLLSDGLSITYTAQSDKETYLDITNHLYVNLSGDFSRNVNSHELQMEAPSMWLNDNAHLPKAEGVTQGRTFDFAQGTIVGKATDDPILAFSHGLNNAFLWKHTARLSSEGLSLLLESDAPYLVLYSGDYLPIPSTALAMEAQQLPDAPNLRKNDKSLFLQKGTIWKQTITLRLFSP